MVFLKLFLYTQSLVASQTQSNPLPPPLFLSSLFILAIYFTYVDYPPPPPLPYPELAP